MKRLLTAILWLLFALSAFGADLKIQWDPKPVSETWNTIRIYERTGAGPYTYALRSEVPGTATETTITGVAVGTRTYIARAVNVWESADSNAVSTPTQPGAPRITIIVTVTVAP